MHVVLLAGGKGTRISEESVSRPKPMIEIGELPILIHIMQYYSSFGHNDFVICAGYRGYMIKEFFVNYYLHCADVTIDMKTYATEWHQSRSLPWRVTVVDTGAESMTGGRLKRIRKFLPPDEDFFMTYGDGLSNVDLHALLAEHKKSGLEATVTAVVPPARFGRLSVDAAKVTGFLEKPKDQTDWINGGFYVLTQKALERIEGDQTIWEKEPMEGLAADGQLNAYFHDGFWQPMDTLRDKMLLEELWNKGNAPWKVAD